MDAHAAGGPADGTVVRVAFLERSDGQPLALLSEAFTHSPVAKAVISLASGAVGQLVEVNAAFCAMVGHDRRDLVGRPYRTLLAEDDVSALRGTLDAMARGEFGDSVAQRVVVRPDGTRVPVTSRLAVVRDGAGGAYATDELIGVAPTPSGTAADDELSRRANAVVRELEQESLELARSAEQFRTAFDGSPLGLLIVDEDGRLRQANRAAAGLAGRAVDELTGLLSEDITHPEDHAAVAAARRALIDGSDVQYDKRLLRPDGSSVWTRVTLCLIPGPDGRRWRLVQLQDITAERAAGAAAAREVQRLRATLAVQREVTAAADRDSALRVVAERAVDLFPAADGAAVELLDGDELCCTATAGSLGGWAGTRIPITGSLSGLALTTDAPVRCRNTGTDPRVDRATRARLGMGAMLVAPVHAQDAAIGVLKISARRTGVFDDTDELQLALLADSLSSALQHAADLARAAGLLEERTRALAALEASETRFRLTFENSPLGVTLSSLVPDDFGRFLQANQAMAAITGYRPDELTRMTFADLQHPDDVPGTTAFLRRLAAGEVDTIAAERRYRHRDGHPIWVASRVAVVRDEHGHARYAVDQVEDVTARRATDAQLRRQARLLELIPAAVIVRDLDGTIRWWNTGAEQLYGWPLARVAGQTTHRLLATAFPDAATAGEQHDRLLHDGRWEGQVEHVTADGRTVTVLSRQVLHHPEPGTGGPIQVLEINTDVTAARAAEQALAQSEQRFRGQFTNSAAGQIIRDLDGTLIEVNPAFAAMLGYTVDQLVGTPDLKLLLPEDAIGSENVMAALVAGKSDSYTHQGRLRHADGHPVEVEVTVSLVRDARGRPRHIVGVISDITDRRAAERARDQAAADLAARNVELEAANHLKLDIIGMLGHEIGNPLTAIQGHAELLTEDWDSIDDGHRIRAMAAITRQAGRLDDIVRGVLTMVTIDAGAIIADRRELSIRDEIGRALTAVEDDRLPVHGDDVTVLFNPGHLQQILINLLSNAAKYGGGATAIRIVVDPAERSVVHVHVEDGGPGVPEEFRPRLFERLARAERDAGSIKGTGLGLYIVRGLAHANQADVRHEPNPAGGSWFTLDLRAAPRRR